MINYELFKKAITERILDYMPEEYQNSQVDIHSISKVNQTLDGLHIVPLDERSTLATPTIYLNSMYEQYQACNDMDKVLREAADSIEKAIQQAPDAFSMLNFDSAKDNIIMQLVNTEQNKGMLENMPHRAFQDLSIIYRWLIDVDLEGISSTMVNTMLAEKLGMDEEQLFQVAQVNTKILLPPTIKSMNEVIRDMFMKDGMPGDLVDMMIGEMPEDRVMYVISNERGVNGAASMLYEEGLHGLAEKLDSDLYIMPSSVHEVIAVSVNAGNPNELAQMVAEINMDQVSLDERLSNQVYHYDKDLRKLSLATDTPNKRLDGIVAEPKLVYDSKNQFR
ncbi:DUF5688 family protein [Anaerobium acetethylicum]|uniref:Uncharacterized protein n=1 Tax=Anaerobium acetethylicum TaxID=1619234 RepID=A0A1D3TWM9_9FIRM|nr:DUF5688 family protein [Anaerobium acetethylicum]SCP98640.1 hypothetical protein SAMN05421730_102354 [Anaerobium acetethylicum]